VPEGSVAVGAFLSAIKEENTYFNVLPFADKVA
jgi:hypothetical protein